MSPPSLNSPNCAINGSGTDCIAEEHYDASQVPSHTQLDIVDLFIDWGTSPASLVTTRLGQASAQGSVPELTWMPCNFGVSGSCGSSGTAFPLANIAAGDYDPYITSVADAMKAYGQPVLLRFAHEMNGGWYPWGNTQGNTPAQYVAAWQHVHSIFAAEGATNVYWLWTPNVTGHDTSVYYPGDAYVDFVGADGYNGPSYGGWRTPSAIFGPVLTNIRSFTSKPIIIGEVGAEPSCTSCYGTGSTQNWGNTTTQTKSVWLGDWVPYLNSVNNVAGFVWSEFSPKKEVDNPSTDFPAWVAGMQGWVSS